jgi:hypothetical protein
MIDRNTSSGDLAATVVPSSFKHIVITRFWFRRFAGGQAIEERPDLSWFQNRCRLFATYCLPTVLAQSVKDFTWFIYFDKATPMECLEQVREIVSRYSHIQIRTIEEFQPSTIKTEIVSEIGGTAEWLLTTRLDTDDGWHRDFVRRLQSSIRAGVCEFLNFPVGIISYRGKAYLYRHQSNAFISLFEPTETAMTVFCSAHEILYRIAPIRQLSPTPAFLQVVHGGNLSNKPRGMRVHKVLAFQGFEAIPELSDPSLDESDIAILVENSTLGLAWRARDGLLDFVKSAMRKMKIVEY